MNYTTLSYRIVNEGKDDPKIICDILEQELNKPNLFFRLVEKFRRWAQSGGEA